MRCETAGDISEIPADLVIDASGRGEGAVRWLAALGIDPPDDREGFIDFIRSLPDPTLAEALEQAEFVRPISRMIYPANRLRHYERSDGLPTAFLPVGDAFCSFNPTYGQGMSCAAFQADALAQTLADRRAGDSLAELGPSYLKRAAEAVQFPRRQANFHDFLYPTTEGDRTMIPEDEMSYRLKLQMAAARDPVVRDLSAAVQPFLEPYQRLFEDDARARVESALQAASG